MQNLRSSTWHNRSRNEYETNEKMFSRASLSDGLIRFLVKVTLFLTACCSTTLCNDRSLEMEQERFVSNRESMWMTPFGLLVGELQTTRSTAGLINRVSASQVAASSISSQTTRSASNAGGYAGLPLLVGMACWLRFRQLSRLSRRFHADGLKW